MGPVSQTQVGNLGSKHACLLSIFPSSQPLVLRQFITQCQTSRTDAVLSSSIGIKGESRLCYLPLLLWQDSILSDLPEVLELQAHSAVPAWEGAISINAF